MIPEYEDARDYPNKIKYLIVFIIAFASLAGPFGTSVMLPAIDDIVNDLNTNVSTVNVSVGIYLLSLGIFPLGGHHLVNDLVEEVFIWYHLLYLWRFLLVRHYLPILLL